MWPTARAMSCAWCGAGDEPAGPCDCGGPAFAWTPPTVMGMAFKGWPVEAVEFYEGLEADNTKSYWQAHKSVYEQCVKAPMEELLVELTGEQGAGRVFRPYRDVRFSKDKTPYKLNCAAHAPGGYISFAADGLFFG